MYRKFYGLQGHQPMLCVVFELKPIHRESIRTTIHLRSGRRTARYERPVRPAKG